MTLPHRLPRPDAVIAFDDTAGDGPAVVLIHGAGMDHTMFETQSAALSGAGYRVVTWDLRGHGESSLTPGVAFTARDALSDLTALLAECRLDRAILVGHSLGGVLAQTFVRENDQHADGIIIMASTWCAGPLSRSERWALRLAAPTLALIPARALPGLMARASAVAPPVIARTTATFARMDKPVFLDVWRATVSLVDPDPDFRSPVPLALIRGARDRTGNIATAMPRWAQAEGITETVVANAGHILTWDEPEATSRALLGILTDWDLGPRH